MKHNICRKLSARPLKSDSAAFNLHRTKDNKLSLPKTLNTTLLQSCIHYLVTFFFFFSSVSTLHISLVRYFKQKDHAQNCTPALIRSCICFSILFDVLFYLHHSKSSRNLQMGWGGSVQQWHVPQRWGRPYLSAQICSLKLRCERSVQVYHSLVCRTQITADSS